MLSGYQRFFILFFLPCFVCLRLIILDTRYSDGCFVFDLLFLFLLIPVPFYVYVFLAFYTLTPLTSWGHFQISHFFPSRTVTALGSENFFIFIAFFLPLFHFIICPTLPFLRGYGLSCSFFFFFFSLDLRI